MTWVALPDDLFVKLAPSSFDLLAAAYSYSSHFLTDGIVPTEILESRPGYARGIKALLDRGYLRREGTDFHVVDYFKQSNKSRDQVEEMKAKTRERVRRHRIKQKSNTLQSECNAVTNAPVTLSAPAPAPEKSIDPPQKESLTPAAAGGRSRSADVDQVITHYQTYHPRARGGKKDRARIQARLQEKHTVEDLIAAIDGCHRSPFHCGENPAGKTYQSLELIMRDADHVLQFLETPQNGAVLSEKTRRNLRAGQSWLDRMEQMDQVKENPTCDPKN